MAGGAPNQRMSTSPHFHGMPQLHHTVSVEELDYEGDDEHGDTLLLNTNRRSGDPCSRLCSFLRAPKIGHNYVLLRAPGPIRSSKLLLILGPHWTGIVFASGVAIVATVLLIAQEHAPRAESWFPWFCVASAAATLATLWATGCSDPGIVRVPAAPGQEARLCPECSMMVPCTAEHCFDCAVCIEGLDHHCVWMGKCIGQRNMAHFKLFNVVWVTYLVVSLLYIALGG